MLSERTRFRITACCWSIVADSFAKMHNPRFRGPDFTWDNWIKMIAKHCVSMVPVNFVYPKNQKNQCNEFALETAMSIATGLVKSMG